MVEFQLERMMTRSVAIRAELGKRSGKFARPLHRRLALREVSKQAAALTSVDGGRLRPAHLLVALVEQWGLLVSSAVTKLGHDSDEVLRGSSNRLIGERPKTPRRKTQDQKEEKKKDSALRRGGWTFLSAVPRSGEKRAACASGLSLFSCSWARLPRSLRGEPGVGKTGIYR